MVRNSDAGPHGPAFVRILGRMASRRSASDLGAAATGTDWSHGMRDDTTVALNRKARHEFTIDDTFEAGLVLTGTEIKSIRAGKANIANAYARIEKGEAWLIGADIAPFEQGNRYNHDPKRTRKLLLHRRQIDELMGKAKAKGQTIVPLRLYLTRGKAKLELGLARGKQLHDKRRDIADRDSRRDMARQLADIQRGR